MSKQMFKDLVDSLNTPLPTSVERVGELREMVAFAEAYSVVISTYLRELSRTLDQEIDKVATELRLGITVDESNEPVEDEDLAAQYKKLTADEKKMKIAAGVADINAKLEYVKGLENAIKRRCSIGQSFIKSID